MTNIVPDANSTFVNGNSFMSRSQLFNSKQCSYCGRKGHYDVDCRKKQFDESNSKNVSNNNNANYNNASNKTQVGINAVSAPTFPALGNGQHLDYQLPAPQPQTDQNAMWQQKWQPQSNVQQTIPIRQPQPPSMNVADATSTCMGLNHMSNLIFRIINTATQIRLHLKN